MRTHAAITARATTHWAGTIVSARISGEADIVTSPHTVSTTPAVTIPVHVIIQKTAMCVFVTKAGGVRHVQRKLHRARVVRALMVACVM